MIPQIKSNKLTHSDLSARISLQSSWSFHRCKINCLLYKIAAKTSYLRRKDNKDENLRPPPQVTNNGNVPEVIGNFMYILRFPECLATRNNNTSQKIEHRIIHAEKRSWPEITKRLFESTTRILFVLK